MKQVVAFMLRSRQGGPFDTIFIIETLLKLAWTNDNKSINNEWKIYIEDYKNNLSPNNTFFT